MKVFNRMFLLALLLAACAASATTHTVTSLADSGNGTLRESILNSASGDVITFAPALSGVRSVNWSNVITTSAEDGTIKSVILSPPTGNRFYRLIKP